MKLKNGTIVLKQGSRDPGPGQSQVRSGSLRSRFKPRVEGRERRREQVRGDCDLFSLKLKNGGNQRWDGWVCSGEMTKEDGYEGDGKGREKTNMSAPRQKNEKGWMMAGGIGT